MIVLYYVAIYTWDSYFEQTDYIRLESNGQPTRSSLEICEDELHTLAIL